MLKESLQYRELEALVNAQRDLYVGFTTLRDLKTLGGMYGDVDLRTAINNGLVQGPRLQVSGRGFQTTGGFRPKGYSRDIPLPSMLETIDNPWDARKGVREQLINGADWIKFYANYDFSFAPDGSLIIPPTFTLEEVQAFVDEALQSKHGLDQVFPRRSPEPSLGGKHRQFAGFPDRRSFHYGCYVASSVSRSGDRGPAGAEPCH